ncbi:hypothetical protein B5S28_g4669 [[Candida] boidinii]|nr:hypothetical protein B5S28_g4669 [[Candida] boidinii]OWB61585.1 hypothetical protein B5S29_g2481 [[Candida] boidinii]OWB70560.1 hypothetical protein B5S31_g238 [[Candida] boidinii]
MELKDKEYTLTIYGAGVMGTAVLSAILKSNISPAPKRIVCCTSRTESAEKLAKAYPSIETTYGDEDNFKILSESDVIVLGLKPFICDVVIDKIGPLMKDKILISLIAGWKIERFLEYTPYVSRVMTNTPAKFGCGMAIVSFSEECKQFEDYIMKLIDPIGKALQLPEKNMDAATALVGSGPAFCLLMMEALTEGGVRMGIPYAVAKDCAAKVMEGTAKMVMETGEHPGALKAQVCTPGGTTIGGLLVMEDKGVRSGISRAVEEAANIATKLGQKK